MTWNIYAFLDGYIVEFHGEEVARATTFDEARAAYNRLRAHAAMAMESLNYTLSQERAR